MTKEIATTMTKQIPPPLREQLRLIMLASKRGARLTREETAQCERLLLLFPRDYEDLHHEVLAQVTREMNPLAR
jgi:hypothetical protein